MTRNIIFYVFLELLHIKLTNFKNGLFNLTVPFNKLVHKGYKFDVVVKTLKLVFVGTYFNKRILTQIHSIHLIFLHDY